MRHSKSDTCLSSLVSKKSGKKYIINPLPHDINLFKFQTANRDQLILVLIKHIFFNEENIFYSLTSYGDEISLFIDSKYVDHFKEIPNAMDPIIYRAIKLYDTVDDVEEIGIISKITKILFDESIPILYVNSYTYNYILVDKANIVKALRCLTNIPQLSTPAAKINKSAIEYPNYFEVLDNTIVLLKYNTKQSNALIVQLIKYLFFNINNVYYSLTTLLDNNSSDNEISLFVDNKIYSKMESLPCIKKLGNYTVLNICENNTIHTVSKILSEAAVPILFVNSFHNNYVLMPNIYIKSAIKKLQLQNFNISA